MARRVRPDLHERFERIVRRAIAKAEREHAAELARLRPRRLSRAERLRAQGRILFRGPRPDPAELEESR